MPKQKVICDTLIWYDVNFGDETLDTDQFDYYGTGSNIADFLASDKLFGTEEEQESIKGGIKTMCEQSTDVIFFDPLSFAAKKLFGVNPNEDEYDQFEIAYYALIEYSNNGDDSFEERVQPARKKLQTVRNNFRTKTSDLKRQIDSYSRSKGLSCPEKEMATLDFVTDWLIQELHRLFGTETDPNLISPHLDNVNLFLKTYRRFLMRIVPSQLPNANHMIDLLQLLYISLNGSFQFWTKDKSLLGKIEGEFDEAIRNSFLYQN